MKKFVAGLLVGAVLASAGMAVAQQNIKMFVNGKEVITDVAPVMTGGRLLVPARSMSEALGANVHYDAQTNRVLVTMKQQKPLLEWITFTALTDYNIKVNFMNNGVVKIITDDTSLTIFRPGFYEGERKTVKADLGDVRMKQENGKQYVSVADLIDLGIKFD